MKLAFVFPGQGSQAVGMLDAWRDHPEVQRTLVEASEALGEDVAELIATGPAERLALTTNTQPVMLSAQLLIHSQSWVMLHNGTSISWWGNPCIGYQWTSKFSC